MPWSLLHIVTFIPTLFIFICISFYIRKKLIDKEENIRLIPIHIISCLLVILEIIKQIKSFSLGYSLTDLPLYYCSLFLFLYFAMSLYKGKNKNYVRLLTLLSGVTLLAVMLVMPQVIYSDNAIKGFFNDFDSFHTVFYHNLVILGTMLIYALDLYDLNKRKDIYVILAFYISYCIIASPMAIILQTNFNQFKNSNIEFIENIRLMLIDSLGYVGGQLIYTSANIFITVGFSTLMYFVFTTIVTKINAKKNKLHS